MHASNFKWEETAPNRWELRAYLPHLGPPNPDGTGPLHTLVVAKKQDEGQWRVSYDKGTIGWPGENAGSLNEAARRALMKLHASNIRAPWINGSVFSPMLGQGISAQITDNTASLSAQITDRAAPTPRGPSARHLSPAQIAELENQVHAALQENRVREAQQVRRTTEELPELRAEAIDKLRAAAEMNKVLEGGVPPSDLGKVKIGYYESHFEYPKEKKMSSFERMVESATHGLKVSVADEAANNVLQVSEALFGDAYPELMKTPAGQATVKALTSLALHYTADKYPAMVGGENMAKGLQAATELVVEAAVRDLVQPQIARITPVVRQLAEIGTQSLSAQLPKT